jgi:hypothetical protein
VGLELVREAYVFQAGTAEKNGLVSKGGRVLTVTAFGKDLEQAIAAAYRSASLIEFEGRILRSDIGHDLVRMRGSQDERPTTGLSAYRPQAMVPSFSALRLYRRLQVEPVDDAEEQQQRDADGRQPPQPGDDREGPFHEMAEGESDLLHRS